jgi:hypothetical protein
MFSTTQQKMKELKAERVTMNNELQTIQDQLRNLKSFTVPQLELDESLV